MEIDTEHGTVLVDDEDAHLLEGKNVQVKVNPGSRSTVRYVLVNGRRLHSLILPPPTGMVVDHRNRNPLDNRRENLRIATHTQNMQNRRGWSRSGFKGVKHHKYRKGKDRECWAAQISVNGTKTILGRFDTPEEAARAYDKAAAEHFGEFAVLNFPENSSVPTLDKPALGN